MKLEELGPVGPIPDSLISGLWFHSISELSHCFLCFSARLRLSGITRVAAGAMPDFRATRRASLPTSITFFFRRFIPDAKVILTPLRKEAC
jgi:hypothetical protein